MRIKIDPKCPHISNDYIRSDKTELIYLQGIRVLAPVGLLAAFLMPASEVAWGMLLLSGSGHMQYRGITPGSSDEMRILSFHRSLLVSLWRIKTNHTSKTSVWPYCLSFSPGRQEISKKIEDSGGLRSGKQDEV